MYSHYIVPFNRSLVATQSFPTVVKFHSSPNKQNFLRDIKTPEIVNYHSTTTNTTQPKNPTETQTRPTNEQV